jgi:hypothetical protein
MVIASLVGFAVPAQFVSLEFLETPYYVALVGAGVLKLSSSSPRTGRETPKWRAGSASGHRPRVIGAALASGVRIVRWKPTAY